MNKRQWKTAAVLGVASFCGALVALNANDAEAKWRRMHGYSCYESISGPDAIVDKKGDYTRMLSSQGTRRRATDEAAHRSSEHARGHVPEKYAELGVAGALFTALLVV